MYLTSFHYGRSWLTMNLNYDVQMVCKKLTPNIASPQLYWSQDANLCCLCSLKFHSHIQHWHLGKMVRFAQRLHSRDWSTKKTKNTKPQGLWQSICMGRRSTIGDGCWRQMMVVEDQRQLLRYKGRRPDIVRWLAQTSRSIVMENMVHVPEVDL